MDSDSSGRKEKRMKQNLPTRREMKFLAKRLMMHPICMRVTLLLVCVQLAFYGLRVFCGGTLTYGLAKLSEYGDTASGIYFNAEGFSILFRMDLTQTVLAIPVTYHQILVFLLVNALFFVLLAPLRLGAMEQYWGVLRGSTQLSVFRVFQWFRQPKRLGKAVAVEFVLSILVRLAGLWPPFPSRISSMSSIPTPRRQTPYTTLSSLTQMGATLLAVAAALFTFWLHSVFLPVRYCLCAHPEYSLGQTFRRGLQSAKGVRGAFFRFRLSYILWFRRPSSPMGRWTCL